MPKVSYVWNFFKKENYNKETKKVKCELCKEDVNYTLNCSTGSLRHHLVHIHNLCDNNYKKHKMYQNKIESPKEASEKENESSISENEPQSTDNNFNKAENKFSMDCLIDFLLSTDQAFSLVDNKEFIQFIRSLNKKFKIPSRKTLVDTNIHNKVKKSF